MFLLLLVNSLLNFYQGLHLYIEYVSVVVNAISIGSFYKMFCQAVEFIRVYLFQDKYIRSLAEMENVRQRMRKQIDDAKLFGIQGFSKDLLEVADVLGKATETVPKEMISDVNPELKALYEGLVLTESQLIKIFKKHGLEQIIPKEGEKFDPYIHQALFEVPLPDAVPGTIATLNKFGYCLHQRTIRPALVGVVKST